jgi:hypothetical protein
MLSSTGLCSLGVCYLDPGTLGKAVQLRTNHVNINVSGSWTMLHYHVSFEPDVQNRHKQRQLVNRARDVHRGMFIPETVLITSHLFADEVSFGQTGNMK